MTFAFSDSQRQQLFDGLGRSDSGAWHLTGDVELALSAYGGGDAVARANSAAVLDAAFAHTLGQLRCLREDLYALPERAQELAALGRFGGDQAIDLTRLAHSAGDALDRLGARLSSLARREGVAAAGPCADAERFVRAVAQAYRNRLNIKPTADGPFRQFLDVLFHLVQRRHADIDELARVLDTSRLARILGLD
ncbi:MAG: hypothetical protein IT479_11140 [Xanthomonadales bacterium]|nr:hypothetical protein [Xanthomonadales bacterium]MCC6593817.1 hypothetical protein [Xanthomonadales bacterium]MCE7930627.1 hypothetical protein [Xanthomonadales bacterium PRO6]